MKPDSRPGEPANQAKLTYNTPETKVEILRPPTTDLARLMPELPLAALH